MPMEVNFNVPTWNIEASGLAALTIISFLIYLHLENIIKSVIYISFKIRQKTQQVG